MERAGKELRDPTGKGYQVLIDDEGFVVIRDMYGDVRLADLFDVWRQAHMVLVK